MSFVQQHIEKPPVDHEASRERTATVIASLGSKFDTANIAHRANFNAKFAEQYPELTRTQADADLWIAGRIGSTTFEAVRFAAEEVAT